MSIWDKSCYVKEYFSSSSKRKDNTVIIAENNKMRESYAFADYNKRIYLGCSHATFKPVLMATGASRE